MKQLEKLIRPHLRTVKAYSSARDEYEGELGVFLDANENSIGSATGELYNRYPDPHQKELKKLWSGINAVRPEQVFFGNGSDEPIDLLIRLFCEPGKDSIVTMPPTYGMYEVSAAINNIDNRVFPLTSDFQISEETINTPWLPTDKLMFICSPNNPSGNLLDTDSIELLLERFPGIVIIDEAYIDFSGETSWSTELDMYPRLVVLQTLSKAWGMAGIRVGVAMGHPYLIQMLDRIKPPYNISLANQKLAISALQNQPVKTGHVELILAEKLRLIAALKTMPLVRKITRSATNFLLVKFDRAEEIFTYLIDNQVIVRNRTRQLHCEGSLRITIGKPEENDRLITLLKNFS